MKIQWPKEKGQIEKQRSTTKHYTEIKDRST